MIPKKAFAPLGFSLAAFLVLGVALAGPSSHVLAEDTPANYTKTITLYPKDLPTASSHSTQVVAVSGIKISIPTSIYSTGDWICLNSDYTKGILFEPFVTASGPHGVGYQKVVFGPSATGNFCLTVGVWSYDKSGKVNHSPALSLSTTEATSYTLNTAYPDKPFIYSAFTNTLSTRIAYLSVSYGCVSA